MHCLWRALEVIFAVKYKIFPGQSVSTLFTLLSNHTSVTSPLFFSAAVAQNATYKEDVLFFSRDCAAHFVG